jgi:hypothetical protein
MKRFVAISFLSITTVAVAMGAAQPQFTIGKDTTVIDGPIKADGTIDYIPAINALLGKDVKNEDNAAIPLLLAHSIVSKDGKIDPRSRQQLEALHATIPEKVDELQFLSSYVARKNGTEDTFDLEESVRLADLEDRLVFRPWKAQEQPLAAEWMMASAEGLKRVEDASRRSKFYVPFCVPTEKSVIGLDDAAINAEPFMSIMMPTRMLLARAQMRAGAGDLNDSLADVRAARNIGRLTDQEHVNLIHLQTLAVELNAMRACAGMAASELLTRQQLNALRQEILALPEVSDNDPIRAKIEKFVALDLVMQCIAGKSLPVMRLMAIDFSGKAEMDLSDWKDANWDVMLRETVRLCSEEVPGDSFLEQSRNWEKKMASEPQGPSVIDNLLSLADGGSLNDHAKAVNVFLKRRDGESRDDYTRRISRWLMGVDLANIRRNLGLHERARTSRILALTGVALAGYKLEHGAYPESLDNLEPTPEVDGFTGKPLLYRREGNGFQLWSVGMNQADDGGAKDDLVVGTEVGK